MKKFICLILSIISILLSVTMVCAYAETEIGIIKTETWYTSFYIYYGKKPNGDKYDAIISNALEVTADIYNDGTIKWRMVNKNKLSGEGTQDRLLIYTYPVPEGDRFNRQAFYDLDKNRYDVDKMSLSTYPEIYDSYINNQNENVKRVGFVRYGSKDNIVDVDLYAPYVYTSNDKFNDYFNLSGEFTPNGLIEKEYTISLFGHNITITPDMLNQSIIVPPEETWTIDDWKTYCSQLEDKIEQQNQYIQLLEAENARLMTVCENLENTIKQQQLIHDRQSESYKALESKYAALEEEFNTIKAERDVLKDNQRHLEYADFDGDGRISVTDAVIFVKFIADRASNLKPVPIK